MYSLALLTLAAAAPPQGSIPYPNLTNNRREVVNFNVETVRGLAPASDGTLYALNTHGSQIVHHMDLGAAPEQIFQTVLNPVAIALWGNDRILVAGAGTHALALHDRTTGDILNVLKLPSEPADLVIDAQLGEAYIACQGANVVARVNLTSFTLMSSIPVPSERPRFLWFDAGDPNLVTDNRVYVAPFLSGNGSTVLDNSGQRSTVVSSYDMNALFGSLTLPDEDLFEINSAANSIQPVKRRVGTMVTAHGRHPNGSYWALNVDSLNADSARQNEPALRGNFVVNRLWIGSVAGGSTLALASEQRDLDGTPASYSAANSVAFPFGLAFENVPGLPAAQQRAFVCSPLDDCVVILDAAGNKLGRVNLPAGSIPLDVEVDRVWNAFLFVHCWGTNKLMVISTANTALQWTLDLGLDPTPAPIQRGREIWYDGHRSKNARASCNSCHPGGKSDFLGWQVSDDPTDRKDVMVTQSLLGIEDTFPYHWRGERALIDFNGAFVDLLGHSSKLSEGPGSEFEDFQAFVFSLQPHANPREPLARDIPDVTESAGVNGTNVEVFGNPVQGANLFQTRIGFNAQSCSECHTTRTGSNGDFINEVATDIPSAQVFEVAHLRELTHKDQPLANVGFPALPILRSRTGFGTAHSGLTRNVVGFVLAGGSFNLNTKESAHVATFVRRFDQGIAPAAHHAVLLNNANLAQIDVDLREQAGAVKHWIDLVAFGTFRHPTTNAPMSGRFMFTNTQYSPVPPTMFLQCNDDTASMTLPTLLAQVNAGNARIVFLGVPPGSGWRFAIDPDNDKLSDFNEGVFGTNPWVQDSDGDGDPDGYEINNGGDPLDAALRASDSFAPTLQGQIDFINASLVKFHVQSNEDVKLSSSIQTATTSPTLNANPVFARRHTYVVQGLVPSTPSRSPNGAMQIANIGKIYADDRSGNQTTYAFSLFAADMLHPMAGALPAAAPQSPLVVSSFTGSKSSGGGSMTVGATVRMEQRFFDAAGVNAAAVQGTQALFQVLRETGVGTNMYVIDPNVTVVTGTSLSAIKLTNAAGVSHAVSSSELPGPFIAAPLTAANGSTSFAFTVAGLANGQNVRVRLISIATPVGAAPEYSEETFGRVFLPASAPEARGIELAYP
ncbi:MAG: hypothetical protein IT454_03850 [Planctomycetes bacterium]|nr:hypothetical protein [Planctomycetota bacterium]